MRTIKNTITTITALSLLLMCTAESHATTNDFQSWNAAALAGNADKAGDLQFWFDGHLRFKDDASQLGVSIFRPGIGYRMSDDLTLWLGVARIAIDSEAGTVEEDRLWQQATYSLRPFLGGNVSARTRLEQRYRSDQGDDVGHRIRQFVRWEKPLGDKWSFVVWDELFVTLNDTQWGQASGFDQNRFYAGPAYQLNDTWRIEVGYMNNYIHSPGASSAEAQINHNLSLTFFGSWF